MPNSLKCRLKQFVHKGLLSEKDLSRLYTDNDVIEELEKIKDRLEVAMWYNRRDKEYCLELIGKRISELKGEYK